MLSELTESNTPKWLWPLAVMSGLLLVVLFALGIVGGDKKTAPGNTAMVGSVLPAGATLITVSQQASANTLVWQGVVRSRWAVKIAPKLNGRIMEITVHAGDSVKKGALIARLDDRDLQAAYQAAMAAQAAASARAAQANADQNRVVALYGKQAVSRQHYDAVIAQAEAARALVKQAASAVQQSQVTLGENVLVAPFDGVVDARLQEPGDMAAPNQPIVTLHKPADLRLEVAIASQCVASIKAGMPVNVRFDTLAQPLTASIDEITPAIDPQTRTQLIKVNLPKTAGVQHGQFGWLELGCDGQQSALSIPASAIVHYGQLEAVKIVDGQTLSTRHIRTGKRSGEQVEVLSGLHEGDTILSNGGLLQ